MNLPADSCIATTSMDLVPKARAGVLASFRVSRYSAALVILRGADGKLLPPGTPMPGRYSDTITATRWTTPGSMQDMPAFHAGTSGC